METINIKGIDKAELLAALHNGTHALGMGVLHDIGRDMTRDEAADILESFGDTNTYRFDYVMGRPLKVRFKDDELHNACLYDRDSSPGACQRVVDSLRLPSVS